MKLETYQGKLNTIYYVTMNVNGKQKKINLGEDRDLALKQLEILTTSVTLNSLWQEYLINKFPYLKSSLQFDFIESWVFKLMEHGNIDIKKYFDSEHIEVLERRNYLKNSLQFHLYQYAKENNYI